MKRLVPFGVVLALVSACGSSHAAQRANFVKQRVENSQRVSPRYTKAGAAREADRLLDAYVPPRGARLLRHGVTDYHWPRRDPGENIVGKRVYRHRIWKLRRSVSSFEQFIEHRGLRGWSSSGAIVSTDAPGLGDLNFLTTNETYKSRGFGGRRTGRLLNIAAVRERHGHGTILRVDVVVAWHLSAAELEHVPAGARTIDINSRHARAEVTDPAEVQTIIRWFDSLEVAEEPVFYCCTPSLVVGEPPAHYGTGDPTFEFVFRNAHGTPLARASFPEGWGTPTATYSIRGHSVLPLLDSAQGLASHVFARRPESYTQSQGIVYRVQELLGANWIGPPDESYTAYRRAFDAAGRAAMLLRKFRPPPGATRTGAPKGYGGVLRSIPIPFGEFAHRTRYWRVRASVTSVVAFLEKHAAPAGFEAHCGRNLHFGSAQCDVSSGPAGNRHLEFSVQRTRDGSSVLRVDAQVVWVYPRSPSESVRASRVRAIDFSTKTVSKHVTDPAEIARIVRWFNTIPIVPPGLGSSPGCVLVTTVPVTLDFRGSGQKPLAHVSATPTEPQGGTSVCNPMSVRIAGTPQPSLISNDFFGRVQREIGVTVS